MIHYDTHLGMSDLPEIFKTAVRKLAPRADEFDSIVTSGTSGLVLAGPLALALGKELVIVRKADEVYRCHHTSDVENARNAGHRALFVDDEIQLGRTLSHVQSQLAKHTRAEVTGTYQYRDDKFEHATPRIPQPASYRWREDTHD